MDWVLLTNGPQWRAYRLRFEKPIQHDEVFALDLLDPDVKPAHLLEKLFLISREAGSGAAIDSYWQQKEATSRYVVAQLLLSETVLGVVRRELRRLFPGLRIAGTDIADLMRGEVLKREVLEGDKADAATRIVRKAGKRRHRAKAGAATPLSAVPTVADSTLPSVAAAATPEADPSAA